MSQTNESAVWELLERWAAAVRAKNMAQVLANHAPDFLILDVPLPFESRALAAYERMPGVPVKVATLGTHQRS